MKVLRISALLLVWAVFATMVAASGPVVVYAQSNPPFQNPSLDSNCYFPQIGDPSEMDTIMGAPGQLLGMSALINLGPKPDGSYGNMFIGNLSPSVALAQVETGPTFDLHKLKQHIQNFDPFFLSYYDGFVAGHFRDTKHLDLFVRGIWRIYWSDGEGNYDSTRYTDLLPNIPRGNSKGDFGFGRNLIQPYLAHLMNDTVDDIVLSAYTDWRDTVFPFASHDTAYLLLYRGGSKLFGRDTVTEDTSLLWYPMKPTSTATRDCIQGDFRGVGRDDLIVADPRGNLCYYRNDPPFSLGKFEQEVTNDTFFIPPYWFVHFNGNGSGFVLPFYTPMRALPRGRIDSSVDLLMVGFIDSGSSPLSIYIFRGNPDFGSYRLTLDSAAFAITHPKFGFGSSPDYDWCQFPPEDAGDMTGTGNHLILVEAGWGDSWWDNFYMTGKALDNKIDIWNQSTSAGGGDTLTANSDSLEDFLEGRSRDDLTSSFPGTLWLYYGTDQIPVHLDSQWADVKNIPTQNGIAFTLSPNPTRLWSVATIMWPEAEMADYEVYNLLGEVVQSGTIRMLGGAEQERMYFPHLASGVYEVLIHGSRHEARAKLVIVR